MKNQHVSGIKDIAKNAMQHIENQEIAFLLNEFDQVANELNCLNQQASSKISYVDHFGNLTDEIQEIDRVIAGNKSEYFTRIDNKLVKWM